MIAHAPDPAGDDTVYRGRRIEGRRGQFAGVEVTRNGRALPGPHLLRIADGYEWGYGGAGPKQLALALIHDVTRDPDYACRMHAWFMWATVACWGSHWQITAGQIRDWLAQCQHEIESAEEDDAEGTGGSATTVAGIFQEMREEGVSCDR